jgi:catecholate siderophore receptor
MSRVKTPRSLRSGFAAVVVDQNLEIDSSLKITVACLMAAGSISSAEAQDAPLPPVTIDAPVTRPKPPAAAKPSPEQLCARTALRRITREREKQAQAKPKPAANAAPAPAQAADHNPYADPAAPYKADHLASPKFTEPLLSTPKSVTVLTKEILDDKNATTLKEIGRSTAGVTLGTGEGGSAFGDRFFIRGYDARNDIFIDGVRDPAVSIRENFFTEQIEILRGPSSSVSGRGTTGGAINIVTKQATDKDFYNAESTLGTDGTKRITIDANQVITPTFSMRVDGMFQDANVAGRDFVFDDRWGGLVAAKWTPTDQWKVTASYVHTNLDALPDFGVPYNKPALAPWTDTGVPRNTFYGFVNRDFQKTQQDFGTLGVEYKPFDNVTISNKFRDAESVLNYIGTLPEAPTNGLPGFVNLNPQSRFQVTDVIADQTDATIKFDTGPIKNTAVVGTEFSRERVSIDSYTGLASEAVGAGAFTGSGSLINQSVFAPPNTLSFSGTPSITGNPTVVSVGTQSAYLMETANYRDFIILNAGIRYDQYNISASKAGSTVWETAGLPNYNAGLVVKPLPYASVYAAYGTSANPVGAEIDGTSSTYGGLNPTSPINQIFAPQRNQAYEVGTKWELFERHFLVTGALFRTEATNAREVIPTGQAGAGNIVAGQSDYIQGIDLEAAGKITDRWSVFSGLVLMQSDVTKSVVPGDVGDRLANIAHQSFTTLTKYQLTDKLEVGGQAIYASKIYGGTLLAANQGTVLPDHWRFDTFAEYKIDKNWSTKVSVTNIFNKTYYDAFYQSAAPFVLIAPGRAAYWIVEAKF